MTTQTGQDTEKRKSTLVRFALFYAGALMLVGGTVILLKPDIIGFDAKDGAIAGPALIVVGITDCILGWFIPALIGKKTDKKS